ncbi:DUF3574 domain-containing protein [Tepidamorphus gemmatus]|uniref:DUF3574 domain-containing protein n=1 Tax=Tepidamorphus gemmatus TaxID=747076 RepID=UPI002478C3DF|nr:DUF3574 domain-containing protein [Tepidamorphus gemmatus]
MTRPRGPCHPPGRVQSPGGSPCRSGSLPQRLSPRRSSPRPPCSVAALARVRHAAVAAVLRHVQRRRQRCQRTGMGAFVREVVTPRFPDGLTVVNADGQGARSAGDRRRG